jgi:hypothetical protein
MKPTPYYSAAPPNDCNCFPTWSCCWHGRMILGCRGCKKPTRMAQRGMAFSKASVCTVLRKPPRVQLATNDTWVDLLYCLLHMYACTHACMHRQYMIPGPPYFLYTSVARRAIDRRREGCSETYLCTYLVQGLPYRWHRPGSMYKVFMHHHGRCLGTLPEGFAKLLRLLPSVVSSCPLTPMHTPTSNPPPPLRRDVPANRRWFFEDL